MFLLKVLVNADRPMSTNDLMDALYPAGPRPGNQIIAVVISNLRKKLQPICGDRNPIKSQRKLGFTLDRDVIPVAAAEHPPLQRRWRSA
jgi:DNA-binding response OmpR family regulator